MVALSSPQPICDDPRAPALPAFPYARPRPDQVHNLPTIYKELGANFDDVVLPVSVRPRPPPAALHPRHRHRRPERAATRSARAELSKPLRPAPPASRANLTDAPPRAGILAVALWGGVVQSIVNEVAKAVVANYNASELLTRRGE